MGLPRVVYRGARPVDDREGGRRDRTGRGLLRRNGSVDEHGRRRLGLHRLGTLRPEGDAQSASLGVLRAELRRLAEIDRKQGAGSAQLLLDIQHKGLGDEAARRAHHAGRLQQAATGSHAGQGYNYPPRALALLHCELGRAVQGKVNEDLTLSRVQLHGCCH